MSNHYIVYLKLIKPISYCISTILKFFKNHNVKVFKDVKCGVLIKTQDLVVKLSMNLNTIKEVK